MAKQENVDLMWGIMLTLFVLWQFIILFAFWGGMPKGIFKMHKEFKQEIKQETRELRRAIIDMDRQFQDRPRWYRTK